MEIVINTKPLDLVNQIKSCKADMSIFGYGSPGWNEAYRLLMHLTCKLRKVYGSPAFGN